MSTFARSRCATACRSRTRSRCRPSSNCSTPWPPPACARWRPRRSSHRRRCPRWPTPRNWRPNCSIRDFDGIEFSALVASPNGAKRAIAAGLRSIEYVVSAADGAQPRQRRAHHRGGHRADRRDRRDRARQRRHRRGHHRHRMGLPVRRPDAAATGARRRHGGPSTAASTGSRSPTPSAPPPRGG